MVNEDEVEPFGNFSPALIGFFWLRAETFHAAWRSKFCLVRFAFLERITSNFWSPTLYNLKFAIFFGTKILGVFGGKTRKSSVLSWFFKHNYLYIPAFYNQFIIFRGPVGILNPGWLIVVYCLFLSTYFLFSESQNSGGLKPFSTSSPSSNGLLDVVFGSSICPPLNSLISFYQQCEKIPLGTHQESRKVDKELEIAKVP